MLQVQTLFIFHAPMVRAFTLRVVNVEQPLRYLLGKAVSVAPYVKRLYLFMFDVETIWFLVGVLVGCGLTLGTMIILNWRHS